MRRVIVVLLFLFATPVYAQRLDLPTIDIPRAPCLGDGTIQVCISETDGAYNIIASARENSGEMADKIKIRFQKERVGYDATCVCLYPDFEHGRDCTC